MQLVEEYVKKNLLQELSVIEKSTIHIDVNLTVYEKAIIYKYSDEGFRETNKSLRISDGSNFDDFGILLYSSISKLPDFKGIVYRKVYLSNNELDIYIQAFKNQTIVKEFAFISTSKFISIAILWAGLTRYIPNCLFVIYTKAGKEIELMSKFSNEKEVLLKPNSKFNVLNIFQEPDFIQITMEEQL